MTSSLPLQNVGHGSTGFLLFPDMNTATALYADDLIAALTTLHAKGRFKRFVLYVDRP